MTQEQRKIAESAYSKVTIALEELMQPVMNPAYRINEARLLPALRMSSPGRWSTTIRLDRDSDAVEELFAVLSLFGFGVYA